MPKASEATVEGANPSMDFIEEILEKVKELVRKLLDTLLGPEAQPESELIPIPVDEKRCR